MGIFSIFEYPTILCSPLPVPIAALETIGSDCFYYSMSLNNGRFNCVNKTLPRGVNLVHDEANDVALAHFEGFSSKASGSLGASQPSARVVKMALERKGGIKCMTVQDELSMQAATCFAGNIPSRSFGGRTLICSNYNR